MAKSQSSITLKERPRIGLGLDWEEEGSFSPYAYYALREHYFQAILKAGGLPIAIPFEKTCLPDYLNHVQGVVIPGGSYPSPSDWYGQQHVSTTPMHPRAAYDIQLVTMALERHLPTLGICAGMQVMAYTQGATFHRNVHQATDTTLNHKQPKALTTPVHEVSIRPDTLLYQLLQTERMMVNSNHNEAIDTCSDHITIAATAPDGVREAIELPDYDFALGVQWHPEFFLKNDTAHFNLFKGLIDACQNGLPKDSPPQA